MAHAESNLTIGEVASRSGLSAATLRYYEELGLIEPAGRRGLTRYYPAPLILERLEIIRLASAIGFTLDEVGTLLARADDLEGYAILARAKLDDLERRRRDLATAAKLLRHTLVCTCQNVTECLSAADPPADLLRSAKRAHGRRTPDHRGGGDERSTVAASRKRP